MGYDDILSTSDFMYIYGHFQANLQNGNANLSL